MRRFFDAVILIGVWMVVVGGGGRLEGALFPVASKAVVISVAPWAGALGTGGYDVSLAFEKMRNCDYKHLRFTRPDGTTIGYKAISPRHGSREPADWEIEWRLYSVTVDDIANLSIRARHQCPWRPYETVTDMSPVW